MKTLLLVVGLVVGLVSVANAAEQPGLQRRRCATGTTMGTSGALTACSGSGEQITGVALTCAGTACAAGLYDVVSTSAITGTSELAFELAAAANGTTYVDLSDAPIRTTTGIAINLDPNGRGIVVFTSQATP